MNRLGRDIAGDIIRANATSPAKAVAGGAPASEWTVETLREYLDVRLAEMDRRYSERFEAQTKALDAAFLSAQTAVQAALLSAEKAVTKAETAAERRFESVNEFRATLSDQARELMSRAEATALLAALDAKITGLAEKNDATALRVEKMASTSHGMQSGWQILVGAVALFATVVGLYLALRG